MAGLPSRHKTLSSGIFLVVLILTLSAVLQAWGAEAPTLLEWLQPAPEADILQLKTRVERYGATVLSLAPDGRLLVRCEPERLPSMKGLASVQSATAATFAEEPVSPPGKGLGARRPTLQDERYISAAFNRVHQIKPNDMSLARALLSGTESLPSEVDNSLSTFFPPIRGQGMQNSCTAWASAYYFNTYTQAKDEGLTVSNGDNSQICSPAFIYNLTNEGIDEGAVLEIALSRLNTVGCPSWLVQPYDSDDWTSWPGETGWVDAIKRRTQNSYVIGSWRYGCSDGELTAIKQHLANGGIAVTGTDVYENWYVSYPADTTGISNGVLFANGGRYLGGHAMTIVGYDDGKSYFDGATTRYGAFLIANSWGPWWGVANAGGTQKGFMWVAYDFFKAANYCFGFALFNSDRPFYRSRIYALAGLNHSARGYVSFGGGVGSASAPDWESYHPIHYAGGLDVAVTEDRRLAVDLTEGVSNITFPGVALFVDMNLSSAAPDAGVLSSAVFYHDFDENGLFEAVGSSDPPIDPGPGETQSASVQFSYSEECEPNDLDGDCRLTPADALCVLQQFVGVCPTDCGACVAPSDVDGDGLVTPADAFCILQRFVGLPSCLD